MYNLIDLFYLFGSIFIFISSLISILIVIKLFLLLYK